MEPIITLSSGHSFDFREPERLPFDIVIIAHALSKLCRFTGHIEGNEIYSVAQHSVLVSRMVPPEDALDGLLHDAHESYVGDMSAPLKLMCPDYCAVERRVEVACRRSFGLPDIKSEAVAVADKRMFEREYDAFMRGWPVVAPRASPDALSVRMFCWPPAVAKAKFLERFEELTA
jgi:hypothetical protein